MEILCGLHWTEGGGGRAIEEKRGDAGGGGEQRQLDKNTAVRDLQLEADSREWEHNRNI